MPKPTRPAPSLSNLASEQVNSCLEQAARAAMEWFPAGTLFAIVAIDASRDSRTHQPVYVGNATELDTARILRAAADRLDIAHARKN